MATFPNTPIDGVAIDENASGCDPFPAGPRGGQRDNALTVSWART